MSHPHPLAEAERAQATPRLSLRRSLILYFVSELWLSVGIGVNNYTQPFLYQWGHMNDARIGLLFAANSLAAGLSALLLGPLCDRVGASVAWKWATLGVGVSYLWTALAHGFGGWLGAAVFGGIANGLLMATENVVLSSLTPADRRAAVLSRFVAFYSLAIAIGMAASGWLCAAFGYRLTMGVAAAITLVSPCIRWFVQAPDARARHAFQLPSWHLVRMGAYSFGVGAAFGLFTPFASLVLRDEFHLSDHTISTISAANLLATSVGAWLVSLCVARLGPVRVMTGAFALAGLGTLGLAAAQGPVPFAALFLLRSACSQAASPVIDSVFLEFTPATAFSQMFGVRVFANTIGNALGSSSAGGLLQGGRLSLSLVLSAAMFALTWGYLYALLRRLRREKARG